MTNRQYDSKPPACGSNNAINLPPRLGMVEIPPIKKLWWLGDATIRIVSPTWWGLLSHRTTTLVASSIFRSLGFSPKQQPVIGYPHDELETPIWLSQSMENLWVFPKLITAECPRPPPQLCPEGIQKKNLGLKQHLNNHFLWDFNGMLMGFYWIWWDVDRIW